MPGEERLLFGLRSDRRPEARSRPDTIRFLGSCKKVHFSHRRFLQFYKNPIHQFAGPQLLVVVHPPLCALLESRLLLVLHSDLLQSSHFDEPEMCSAAPALLLCITPYTAAQNCLSGWSQ